MEGLISISNRNIDSISEQYLKQSCTVLYGAGGNGIRLLSVLKKHGVQVQYFCDDDFNKWHSSVSEIPVLSFDELKKNSENIEKGTVNVVLTSVFSGPILKKLKQISKIQVFEPFEILRQEFFPKSFYNTKLEKEKKHAIIYKFDAIIPKLMDNESKHIMDVIRNVIDAQENADNRKFTEIASEEDCYFISEVCASLPQNPVVIDCGGFTGDLMVALKKHHIEYDKVFSFEPNPQLYAEMCENVKKNHIEEKFIPLHRGVWDSNGIAYLDFDESDIAGGKINSHSSGTEVETIAIDSFFKNQSVDFIKMDIEGAELHALMGGSGVIRRDRPILAISLYHSPYDVVDIPEYLMNELENYMFIVRHHSFIGSETVLYALPVEKIKS